MALTRVELDAGRCEHCDDPGHVHEPLVLNQRCHPMEDTRAEYHEGVLTVRCAACDQMVAEIAVAGPVNLKEKLMHLGNRLVALGYDPADLHMLGKLRALHRGRVGVAAGNAPHSAWPKVTGPYRPDDMERESMAAGLEMIVLLTEWLNVNEDAQGILSGLGVDWPVAQR